MQLLQRRIADALTFDWQLRDLGLIIGVIYCIISYGGKNEQGFAQKIRRARRTHRRKRRQRRQRFDQLLVGGGRPCAPCMRRMLPLGRAQSARQLQRPHNLAPQDAQRKRRDADRYPLFCRGYEEFFHRSRLRRHSNIVRRSAPLRRGRTAQTRRIFQGCRQGVQALLRLRDDQQDSLDIVRRPVPRLGKDRLPRRHPFRCRKQTLGLDCQDDAPRQARRNRRMGRTLFKFDRALGLAYRTKIHRFALLQLARHRPHRRHAGRLLLLRRARACALRQVLLREYADRRGLLSSRPQPRRRRSLCLHASRPRRQHRRQVLAQIGRGAHRRLRRRTRRRDFAQRHRDGRGLALLGRGRSRPIRLADTRVEHALLRHSL